MEAHGVYKEIIKMVEKSIHVVFDENNGGIINSTLFQDLKLSRRDDEEKGRAKSNKATI